MYIPGQQSPIAPPGAAETLQVVADYNVSVTNYPGMLPPELRPPYDADQRETIAVVVQTIWVMWFLFIVLMMW
jgi:hypothetical protein